MWGGSASNIAIVYRKKKQPSKYVLFSFFFFPKNRFSMSRSRNMHSPPIAPSTSWRKVLQSDCYGSRPPHPRMCIDEQNGGWSEEGASLSFAPPATNEGP